MLVQIDYKKTPMYTEHEKMSRSIIDSRILPLLEKANELGASMPNEIQRLKDALSGCPLLTINIPKLLDAKDGRGIGLLPLVIMMNELKGFESLEYLKENLWKLQ